MDPYQHLYFACQFNPSDPPVTMIPTSLKDKQPESSGRIYTTSTIGTWQC
jgi:hypothetical protein